MPAASAERALRFQQGARGVTEFHVRHKRAGFVGPAADPTGARTVALLNHPADVS